MFSAHHQNSVAVAVRRTLYADSAAARAGCTMVFQWQPSLVVLHASSGTLCHIFSEHGETKTPWLGMETRSGATPRQFVWRRPAETRKILPYPDNKDNQGTRHSCQQSPLPTVRVVTWSALIVSMMWSIHLLGTNPRGLMPYSFFRTVSFSRSCLISLLHVLEL